MACSGMIEHAGIGGDSRIPPERNRHGTIQSRNQSARGFRCSDFQVDGLATLESFVIQLHLNDRRLAGNDERLGLAIRVTNLVAQNEPHRVGAVLHIRGRKKARLPDVFRREMAQRLHQSEGKQGDDGNNRLVGLHAKDWIARADDARAQQRTRDGKERRVWRDELVLAREADDLIDGSLVLAVALDFCEQRIHAGARPEARQLRMLERFARQVRFSRKFNGAAVTDSVYREADVLLRLLIAAYPRCKRTREHRRLQRIDACRLNFPARSKDRVPQPGCGQFLRETNSA